MDMSQATAAAAMWADWAAFSKLPEPALTSTYVMAGQALVSFQLRTRSDVRTWARAFSVLSSGHECDGHYHERATLFVADYTVDCYSVTAITPEGTLKPIVAPA